MRINRSNPEPSGAQQPAVQPQTAAPQQPAPRREEPRQEQPKPKKEKPKKKSLKSALSPRNTRRMRRTRRKSPAAVFQSAA